MKYPRGRVKGERCREIWAAGVCLKGEMCRREMCNTRERDDGKAHIQGGRGIKEEQEVGVGRISETRQKPGTVERGRAFDLHHHDSSQHSLPSKNHLCLQPCLSMNSSIKVDFSNFVHFSFPVRTVCQKP